MSFSPFIGITHHIVIYYKQDGTLKHKSLACISDMLDVHTVYTFQERIISNIVKKDLPQIEKMIYSVTPSVDSIKIQ